MVGECVHSVSARRLPEDSLPHDSASRFASMSVLLVWRICAPAYADASRGGRPGIDPVVNVEVDPTLRP